MSFKIAPYVITIALVLPSLSFASPADQGVTRSQVRAELSQLEQAGFQPGGANIEYPRELRHAERVLQESRTATTTDNTATVVTADNQGL